MALKRWLYRGGHPNRLAKMLNKGWAFIHALGFFPNYLVTLEVTGRQSGKTIDFPLAMTVMNGERYLVSMLGQNANWVRNVRAAGGKARLRHGISEDIFLKEVDVAKRAPILKAFLQHAPGARPHIPVDKAAPLSEFEKLLPGTRFLESIQQCSVYREQFVVALFPSRAYNPRAQCWKKTGFHELTWGS